MFTYSLHTLFFFVIDPVYPVFGCQHHVKFGCYGETLGHHPQGKNEKSENVVML
jgi:hypothetical protein